MIVVGHMTRIALFGIHGTRAAVTAISAPLMPISRGYASSRYAVRMTGGFLARMNWPRWLMRSSSAVFHTGQVFPSGHEMTGSWP